MLSSCLGKSRIPRHQKAEFCKSAVAILESISIVSATGKLGRFLQEVGRIVRPGTSITPPAPEELQHFMEVSKRYGYWVATPEENAAVGISLF
jgi:hypothetical protein